MILNGAENELHTSMILVNLQEELDILDHIILIEKMKSIGFTEKTMGWFHSYFTTELFLFH